MKQISRFCDAALPKLVGYVATYAPSETSVYRLTQRMLSVDVPPGHLPMIHLSKERPMDRGQERFEEEGKRSAAYAMERIDGPMLLRIEDLVVPIIAMSVRYHDGPDSSCESVQDIVVIAREGVQSFVALMKSLDTKDGKPRLK